MKHTLTINTLLLALPAALFADEPAPIAKPASKCPAVDVPSEPWSKPDPTALKRWQEMRFGLFINWGPVSISGQRIGWSRGSPTPIEEYDNLYKKFDAPKFNPDEWASIGKAAGMKYVVFDTKHHDGFCLWDTKQTDYNVMNAPLKRDVAKEVAEAFRKQGLGVGFYHSVCDWHHPDFPRTGPGGSVRREKSDIVAYRRYLRAQVTELIKNYGPLQVMWFDVPMEFDQEQGWENVRLCRTLQPDILVNDRAGGTKGQGLGDFSTPERQIGAFNMERPWESCITLGNSWSWKENDAIKPFAECIQLLVNTAGGDGNLLLNVGPMPDGRIEPRQAERLKEMGDWLAKYGQSIYATRGGPYMPARHVASTRNGNTVYVHIIAWPEEVLRLPALPARIVSSSLLTGGKASVEQTAAGIEIRVPASARQESDTIVALELDKPALEIAPIPVASLHQPLTVGKKAKASSVLNVLGNVRRYAADRAVDGDNHTRWCTAKEAKASWLEVDLGKPETFDRAVILESGTSVKRFELQAQEGDVWKTFHSGKTIGPAFDIRFAPVTAQHVRLSIIDAAKAPSILEFQLFAPRK